MLRDDGYAARIHAAVCAEEVAVDHLVARKFQLADGADHFLLGIRDGHIFKIDAVILQCDYPASRQSVRPRGAAQRTVIDVPVSILLLPKAAMFMSKDVHIGCLLTE